MNSWRARLLSSLRNSGALTAYSFCLATWLRNSLTDCHSSLRFCFCTFSSACCPFALSVFALCTFSSMEYFWFSSASESFSYRFFSCACSRSKSSLILRPTFSWLRCRRSSREPCLLFSECIETEFLIPGDGRVVTDLFALVS